MAHFLHFVGPVRVVRPGPNSQQLSKATNMLKKEFFKGQRIRIIEQAWADHTDGFATGDTATITEPEPSRAGRSGQRHDRQAAYSTPTSSR